MGAAVVVAAVVGEAADLVLLDLYVFASRVSVLTSVTNAASVNTAFFSGSSVISVAGSLDLLCCD